MTDKKAHYSELCLRNTRFFVRTDEHILPLPWWTTRFHACKAMIDDRASFPHHVVDARELTLAIAKELAEKDRKSVVLDRLGVFAASDAALVAMKNGEQWALFCEVCSWLGGKPGWENASYVGDDGKPNWLSKPQRLERDLMAERDEALS